MREIVGVALFLVAGLVAFSFLDPAASSTKTDPRVSRGQTVTAPPGPSTPPSATVVDEPGPTVTPVPPPSPLPAATGWLVMFVSISPAGSERVESRVAMDAIDLSFPGVPFADMRDDAWKIVAESSVQLPAEGRYTFGFEHDGEARLFVDGKETAFAADGPASRRLEATFAHAAGPATVRIEVRDTGGPTRMVIR